MDVLMPQLGETVAEGKITKWFRSAGEEVRPGDNLFEIETDKASMEVQSTVAGVLSEIRVGEGKVVPVGAVVAIIADAVGANGGPAAARAAVGHIAAPTARATNSSRPGASVKLDPFLEVRTPIRNYGAARVAGGASTTPLTRRMAVETGIDLRHVRGSGPHGRILARDVSATRQPPRPGGSFDEGPTADQVKASYEPGSYEEVPLDSMRAIIAARLMQAKQTIPHFYLTADLEIDDLLRLREEMNAAAPRDRDGNVQSRLSLNDLIIKAWAASLQRVPPANAVWAGDRILKLRHSDVGVAVAIEGGVLTPIIRRAESKSLSTISAEVKELSERARARRLMPSEYQGGSSVVSNLGMYGIREFAAIINPPHATVLAIGAARRQALEKDDRVVFVTQMTVTLSCDHRIIDGAVGAELLSVLRGFIEKPVTALA